jgi:hypothetical protein
MSYQVVAVFPTMDAVKDVRQQLPAAIEVRNVVPGDGGIEVVFHLPATGGGLEHLADPGQFEQLHLAVREHGGEIKSEGPRLWDMPSTAAEYLDAHVAKYGLAERGV